MEETQYTQYPAQPEGQPAYQPVPQGAYPPAPQPEYPSMPQPEPQPKKKNKLGLILAIGIPVLVVLIVVGILAGISISKKNQYEEALELLEDGDIAEAIEIHQKLGDYENLEKKICEAAEDECQSLLKKNSYSKVEKLYTAVAGYPDAVRAMDKKLKKHITTLLDDYDFEGAIAAYDKLSGNETVAKLVADQIGDVSSDLWEEDSYAFLLLVSELKEQDLRLDAVEEATYKYASSMISYDNYYQAVNVCLMLPEDSHYRSDFCDDLAEAMLLKLQEDSYYVYDIIYAIDEYDLDGAAVYQTVYDYSCDLMEREEYENARNYLELIRNYMDVADKLAAAEVGMAKEELIYYLENGWYWDARYLVNCYEGETYEQLREIYLQYSADNTFLVDLEAALLERIEYALSGEEYYVVAKLEWDLLEKYNDLPFFDEYLQELAAEYLNALYYQMHYAEWYSDNYYDQNYYWLLYAADRYDTLNKLHEAYGFNPENEYIRKLFTSGEQTRMFAEAWYCIHLDLEWQLWGTYANEDSEGYYLEYTNYTEYTFDLDIWNYFVDYYSGETVHNVDGFYENVQPGDTVKIYFTFPEDTYDYYWYVDWNMMNIYSNGNLLDLQ